MTDEDTTGRPAAGQSLVTLRLAAGLIQGLALYLLYLAADHKVWPATDGQIYAPLLFISFATPVIFILSIGNLRPRTTLFWVLGATALSAFIGWYDIWHGWPTTWVLDKQLPTIVPSILSIFGLAVLLFITHALVAGGDHDHRFRATYPTHFDISWKLSLQLALAFGFFLIFWAMLWLGAALFSLVKLTFFRELLMKPWFYIPVSAATTALALHVTDVRPTLVRGARTLVLVLLSWLLPVMTAIVIAFLAALVLTGLTPLWETRSATALLLIATIALIVLINATYQDGAPEKPISRVFRISASAAALALTPLSLLAAYALYLRVAQYGWTVDRITAAVFVFIALAYAGGYAFAAMTKSAWLQRIEKWNFAVALLVLASLFAYFSPLADPFRISVSDQMARLESKRISAKKFDFVELRWEGGRFGKAALERLVKSTDHALANRASEQLTKRSCYDGFNSPFAPEKAITVYPRGKKLPQSFLEEAKQPDSKTFFKPDCLRFESHSCDAFLIDFDRDGRDEILIISNGSLGSIFVQNTMWESLGYLAGKICPEDIAALKAGTFQLQAKLPRYRALQIGENSFTITLLNKERSCNA